MTDRRKRREQNEKPRKPTGHHLHKESQSQTCLLTQNTSLRQHEVGYTIGNAIIQREQLEIPASNQSSWDRYTHLSGDQNKVAGQIENSTSGEAPPNKQEGLSENTSFTHRPKLLAVETNLCVDPTEDRAGNRESHTAKNTPNEEKINHNNKI
ncbi:hypothetical protein F2Q70_00034628 [Brassica cretica]|uniref:Uncharacterized protein n=1 Tax=Brassica cretica TaxID=69181 RepID=A0A8S9JXL5_BRACR|nr:hypothetical protein F2Q70_00034628 [Brassica cretica]